MPSQIWRSSRRIRSNRPNCGRRWVNFDRIRPELANIWSNSAPNLATFAAKLPGTAQHRSSSPKSAELGTRPMRAQLFTGQTLNRRVPANTLAGQHLRQRRLEGYEHATSISRGKSPIRLSQRRPTMYHITSWGATLHRNPKLGGGRISFKARDHHERAINTSLKTTLPLDERSFDTLSTTPMRRRKDKRWATLSADAWKTQVWMAPTTPHWGCPQRSLASPWSVMFIVSVLQTWTLGKRPRRSKQGPNTINKCSASRPCYSRSTFVHSLALFGAYFDMCPTALQSIIFRLRIKVKRRPEKGQQVFRTQPVLAASAKFPGVWPIRGRFRPASDDFGQFRAMPTKFGRPIMGGARPSSGESERFLASMSQAPNQGRFGKYSGQTWPTSL